MTFPTRLGGGDMEIFLGCQACRVLWHNQVAANSSKPFCSIGTINLLADRYRAKCILMQQTPALLDYTSYVVNDMNNHLVPKALSELQVQKWAVHMFFGQKAALCVHTEIVPYGRQIRSFVTSSQICLGTRVCMWLVTALLQFYSTMCS